MLTEYKKHVKERCEIGLPPLPLNADQVKDLVELFLSPPKGEDELLSDLLINRILPGVNESAYIKAEFLKEIAKGEKKSPLIDRINAVELLGTMGGGYNVPQLIDLLEDEELGSSAAKELSNIILIFEYFNDVSNKSVHNNKFAIKVLNSWAEAKWFTSKKEIPDKLTVVAFKVDGEINTDDLSPADEAWSRTDIPLHATAMLKNRIKNPIETINNLKQKGYPIAFIGDVVGTGSSRKSAVNSLLWHIGNDIPHVPNKRQGGIILAGKIAPIFFNTLEDSGAFPIECDVKDIKIGDIINIYPYEKKIVNEESGKIISEFEINPERLLDEVRANGRIKLIIGQSLTDKACKALKKPYYKKFLRGSSIDNSIKGFTLAQKIVGRACGLKGVRPGQYCEPIITTVGSQDTTGPMTRDELNELACLKFSADLFMQSFCHTAAYPKVIDIKMHKTLPEFIRNRGGVSLRPGDGIIHSWLNRMLLPDTVGTGGDSHTRFPIGISFPAGSGMVAFAAALGIMPIDMPESVLVRFSGKLQKGITLRDLVNSIPYFAISKGLLNIAKDGKKNIFSGRILEIEGLHGLKVEEGFELTCASAERSAAACTIDLSKESVIKYLESNITLLKRLVFEGYGDSDTILRRIRAMEDWISNPVLLKADDNANYKEVLEINLNKITEPILACPNDPDDVRLLSEVSGEKIDEVFIGSCMSNIEHFRSACNILKGKRGIPTRLWITPPTRIDSEILKEEGCFSVFGNSGVRIEVPGCSLCMGNQARVADNSKVVSTSTRNFPNRIGNGANVYLASSELAAVCALLGRIPDVNEYHSYILQAFS